MRFALGALPETFINILQSIVSMRRISKYLNATEVSDVAPLHDQEGIIAFNSATISWPRDRVPESSMSSVASTPRQKFQVNDLNLRFPKGELSLICGKLGELEYSLGAVTCRWICRFRKDSAAACDAWRGRCLGRSSHLTPLTTGRPSSLDEPAGGWRGLGHT
jgi:hypothetical protein